MSLIIDTINAYLPLKRKTTPSGWVSFDAVCCHHNGTSADTRNRGGVFINNDGVSYHCFNCGFKASWQLGRRLTDKLRNLLRWLQVPDDLITKCSFEALRTVDDEVSRATVLAPTFFDKPLPRGADLISNWINNCSEEQLLELVPVLEYISSRGLFVDDYPWYWTNEEGFTNRLIIPFYYQSRIVGYTARLIRDGKPKYLSEQQPGYVFNLDHQLDAREMIFVCEGPLDAISIDAVAIMSNEVSPSQRFLLDRIYKQKVVVPDKDEAGKKLINQALEFGWAVSFPEWDEGIKDINDAVKRYGRLYTLWNIAKNVQTSALKIQLYEKKWV